jgi:mannitol/fructose-specific phosphotransferase system IIA component (Ntr-type)
MFAESLKKETILDIKKMPKEQALNLLIKKICEDNSIADIQQFRQSIISREMLMSTGIGNGIAIPHARLDNINGLKIGIIRCLEGIPYESIDDKPVYFIFMIASSIHSNKEYLKLLAALTSKIKETNLFNELLNAKTTDEIYDLLIV